MALGDHYTHFANERMATITDSDVRFIDTEGSVMVADNQYVVIKHPKLAMDRIHAVKIDGVRKVVTMFPDGKYVSGNRVSATQTVLKNASGGARLIEVLTEIIPFPSDDCSIGSGIIGYTFKVK